MSQPSMDTLSTLREVNSNPPSPESSISVFPQLVISPPLCGDASDNVDPCTKPQNGLDPFPTNEAPSLETLRWSASVLFNITRLLTFNIIPIKFNPTLPPSDILFCFLYFQNWFRSLLFPHSAWPQGISLDNCHWPESSATQTTGASVLTSVLQANLKGIGSQFAKS